MTPPDTMREVLALFETTYAGQRRWLIAYHDGDSWYDLTGTMLDCYTPIRWQELPPV